MLKALSLPSFYSNIFSGISGTKTKKQFARSSSGSNLYWLSVLFISANVVVLMSYVIGVNSYASKGFEIKTLQARMDQLTKTNKALSLKVAEVSSMVNIQSDFLGADFVTAGTPKFLQTSPQNQITQR
jgi:cell division protein FtsB